MAHITRVLAVPAVGTYYYEDLDALQSAPILLGERCTADPVTPGFRRVREVAGAVHVALATRPDIIMTRPGMGVDEGVALVRNEMARTLAWIRSGRERS